MRNDLENYILSILSGLKKSSQLAEKELIEFVRKYSKDRSIETQIIGSLWKLRVKYETEEKTKIARSLVLQEIEEILHSIEKNYTAKNEKDVLKEDDDQNFPVHGEKKVVIKVENLSKTYASSKFELKANQFELELGKVTGIVGENSTGKSTFFKLLAGKIAPTSGTIKFPGISDSTPLNWAKIKKNIAYVSQELPKWNDSLETTLRYEAALNGKKKRENDREFEYIVHRLGLYEHLKKNYSHLSGGFKMRFSLARALIKGSSIILLDEPLAQLDIKSQQVFLNDICSLAYSVDNPLAVLISSQHIHEIEEVADNLYFMDNGIMSNLGKTEEFNKDRKINVFEFSSEASSIHLLNVLSKLEIKKFIENFQSFVITTDTSKELSDIVDVLNEGKIKVKYIRDISTSVKTKFYEEIFT